MSSNASPNAPLLYVDCNVPDADMVADWRRGGGATRHRAVRRVLRRQSAQPAKGGDTQVGVRASDS